MHKAKERTNACSPAGSTGIRGLKSTATFMASLREARRRLEACAI